MIRAPHTGWMVVVAMTAGTLQVPAEPARANERTVIPLHAEDTHAGGCETAARVCRDHGATTDVSGITAPVIHLLLSAYDDCLGVQAALEVPGDWPFVSGRWDCQSNQLSAKEPGPPWGPTDGTITTAFDRIVGGVTAVIGRLHFSAPGSGCITIVESSFPFGTHVIDSDQRPTGVSSDRRGSVCNRAPGVDVCEAGPDVEPSSWGRVKSRFH